MKKIGLPSYIRHIVKEDNRSARFTCGVCMSRNQCWSACQKTSQTCQTKCEKSKQCTTACERSSQAPPPPPPPPTCTAYAEQYRADGTILDKNSRGVPIKCYEDYSGLIIGGIVGGIVGGGAGGIVGGIVGGVIGGSTGNVVKPPSGGGGGGACVHDWVKNHGVFPDCLDARGHEWYNKCSICKVVIGTGRFKPGVLKWEVTALDTTKCKLWGYCDHCGKPYYQYPPHNFVNGVCTVCGYSGAFNWNTPKVKGRPFVLTADEWNAFCDAINQKRKVKGLNTWRFTRVYKGNNVTASIFNDVRQSISGMGGRNLPAAVRTDQDVEAYHLNALVDSFNAI